MITEDHGSWFADYISLLHDPAHWLFEITVSIIFDLFVVYFGYQILVKRFIIPRLRKEIHEEIDREHELTHEEAKP
jgi:hypothetical protein